MNGAIVGLGMVLLIAGAFLFLYSVTYTEPVFGVTLITRVEYPYRNYSLFLFFFGILALIMGLVMSKKSEP
jgi:hypothetical protein